MAQLILVLNPGSTSTKAAVYEDERPLLSCSIAHTNQDLAPYPTLYDQLDYRVSLVRSWLAQEGFDLKRLAAVVGRRHHPQHRGRGLSGGRGPAGLPAAPHGV